jgi:hypothetical protein
MKFCFRLFVFGFLQLSILAVEPWELHDIICTRSAVCGAREECSEECSSRQYVAVSDFQA